jgi:HK97 family phage portal protein
MGFVDLVRSFMPSSRKDVGEAGPLMQMLRSWQSGGESPRLNRSNMGSYLSRYADQAWIYSCIKIIQTKAAGVALKVYKRTLSADGEEELVEQKNHPLTLLLESVNPFMNGYDLRESTHGYIELAGNAYWLLDKIVDGKPTEIYPLNPSCVRIVADKTRYITGYAYEVVPGIVDQTFTPEEIVHFKNWNPIDDLYGLAPICAARDSSDMMMFSDQYNKAFFRNGAEPGGFLTSDRSIDEDSRKRISSTWKKLHQGIRKAHNVAISRRRA